MELEVINEGVNKKSIIMHHGEKVFARELSINFDKKRFFLKGVNFLLQQEVFTSPFYRHTIGGESGTEYIDKELLTWKLWKERGFPVLHLVATDQKKCIQWKYMDNCISCMALVNAVESFGEFEKMLEVYSRIRRFALDENNINLLHSDPNLGNFLFDKKQKEIIPIDSDTLLNSRLKITDLNIALLNITLSSILQIQQQDSVVKQYVSLFGESLSPSELQGLYTFNREFPLLTRLYYRLRNEVRIKIKRKQPNILFSGEKNFQKRFKTCVKDVLFKHYPV